MNKELEAVLKATLLKAGLLEDSNEFKAIMAVPFKDISDKLEVKLPVNLDEALKIEGFQSDFDKKITSAIQKREENLRAQWDFVEKGAAPKKETALEKQVREMQEANAKRDAREALAKKTTAAEKLLEGKKIPKAFLNHFDFEGETSLEDQIEGVEEIYTEVKQSIISNTVGGGKLPTGGVADEVSEKDAKDLVDEIY